MRIFLTGATGYIGGAVAGLLRDHNHDVDALVRPDSDAAHLRERGVGLVAGDLTTLPSLDLSAYDAFIHTAFTFKDTVTNDRAAVDAFTAQPGFFVYTSGVWVLGNTTNGDERSPLNPLPLVAWRAAHEPLVLASGRNAVLRPGCVYGGKQSLLADWFKAAAEDRPLRIVGDGRNRWAMVDVHELADLYVRVVEQRAAGVFHGIDDTHDTIEECARALSPRIEKIPADAARQTMGPFVDALVVDQVIASEITRRAVGWSPKRTFVNSIA